MKAEVVAQQGLGLPGGRGFRVLDIDPECTLAIGNRLGDTLARPVEVDLPRAVALDDTELHARAGRGGGGVRFGDPGRSTHGSAPDVKLLAQWLAGRGRVAW